MYHRKLFVVVCAMTVLSYWFYLGHSFHIVRSNRGASSGSIQNRRTTFFSVFGMVGDSGSVLKGDIDLDVSVPIADEIYDRLVLLTAFSDNHFNEAMGYIGTAQKHMPGKRIIVYNLGLTDELLQKLVLNEFGAVYYGDASIRFKKSLKELIPGIERHHGYMTNIRTFDPLVKLHHYQRTVPEMFVKLGIDRDEYRNCRNCAPHFQPTTQLIVNSTTIQTKLMQPWLQCGLDKECIAPEGSSLKNHRQDASAITLLAYKNFFGEWTEEDNDNKKMLSVLSVEKGTDGRKENPQYCHEYLKLW